MATQLRFINESRRKARARRIRERVPPAVMESVLAIGAYQLAGGKAVTITNTVADLTGRPPRTAAEFVQEHASAFRGQNASGQPAASLSNPVPSTPESIAAGKRVYDANCAACHGDRAQGAVKAGITISILEEQRGKQPPDLTDDQWDHGSGEGDIFTVIKRGLPPSMMAGFEGRIADADIWNIVNYLRSLRQQR